MIPSWNPETKTYREPQDTPAAPPMTTFKTLRDPAVDDINPALPKIRNIPKIPRVSGPYRVMLRIYIINSMEALPGSRKKLRIRLEPHRTPIPKGPRAHITAYTLALKYLK